MLSLSIDIFLLLWPSDTTECQWHFRIVPDLQHHVGTAEAGSLVGWEATEFSVSLECGQPSMDSLVPNGLDNLDEFLFIIWIYPVSSAFIENLVQCRKVTSLCPPELKWAIWLIPVTKTRMKVMRVTSGLNLKQFSMSLSPLELECTHGCHWQDRVTKMSRSLPWTTQTLLLKVLITAYQHGPVLNT